MPSPPASKPLTDPLADNLINELRRASMATLGTLSERFEALGLRVIDAATLRVVEANPGCNQAEVGRLLGVQRTNMVPIVAALVEAGHIDRRAADGRTHALHLTRKGKAMFATVDAVSQQVDAQFFGRLDADAQAQLLAALRAILDSAPT